MKLPSLSALSTEALEIEKQLLETGELTPELEIRSDENKLLLPKKIDHYFHAHENMSDKIKRLKESKKQIDLAIKRLEVSQEYLVKRLEFTKTIIGELKGECGEWVEKESSYIEVTNPDLLPMDCVRVKIEPDKTRISERIEAGETVPGASKEKRKTLKYKEKR